MNHLLLMMGGSGTRFGADRPKQYVLINDRPLFSYLLEKLNKISIIDSITIVSHINWIDYVEEWSERFLCDKKYYIVAGGNNRSKSVKNGLDKLSLFTNPEDVVLIHDVTHPYVDEEGMRKIVEMVHKHGGATLGKRSYDTVYRIDKKGFVKKVEPRELIYAGASPEAFRFQDIYDIYKESSEEELANMTSAGAIALANNIKMKMVETDIVNLKVTYASDLILFEKLYSNQ